MTASQDNYWMISINGDVSVCVEPEIGQMSTYVLLEQEDWFEDEMNFVRKFIQSDMFVLDIGANHGVYALSIAKSLTTGHVWAFEPTKSPAKKLEVSIEFNGFSDFITLVKAGLSDKSKSASMDISQNSELNSLHGTGGIKESIILETLDGYLEANNINAKFSFVKLDAEGEEINVLKGGRSFFSQQSPLVMFELKHGNEVNYGLIDVFKSLGYEIYRLLPDLDILVEYDDSFQDGYLLNLFACKPDYSEELKERGLLTTSLAVNKILSSNLTISIDWLHRINRFPYAKKYLAGWENSLSKVPTEYLAALSASLQTSDTSLSAAHRVALLAYASHTSDRLLSRSDFEDAAPLLLKIDLLHRSGLRSAAVNLAIEVLGKIQDGLRLTWPFVPIVTSEFDRVPNDEMYSWLNCCLGEFIEKRKHFSSYFETRDPLALIPSLLSNPNHTLSIDRRGVLIARRFNKKISISRDHPLFSEGDTKNAEIWRRICQA